MKLFSIIILISIAHSVFSQQSDTISTEVKNFWKIVDENAKFEEKKADTKKQFSEEEIKEIAKKLYSATEKDPFGFAKYIITAHAKYLNDGKSDPNLRAPYPKLYMLEQEINKLDGDKFGEILETPFLIRGKILRQIDTVRYFKKDNFRTSQTKLIVQLEDVIKGKRYFQKDEIIEVNFLDIWIYYPLHLTNGLSYFMAIRIWGDKCKELCLTNYSPGDLEIYPIVNETIEIRKNVYGKNTFELGEKIEWNKFITSFNEKYILEEGEK